MSRIRFTANHEDLSTCRGYQFKFCCDKCGNGYVTRQHVALTGIAGISLGFLDFFGWGRWVRAWWRAGESKESGRLGKPHYDAFAQAVEECKGHFHQCPLCGKWVCSENCWNEQVHQCGICAPNFQQELTSQKAQVMTAATGGQSLVKARQVVHTKGIDLIAPAANGNTTAAVAEAHFCSECGAKVMGGRFCSACGKALIVTPSAG
jgi:hypothetical protein